MATIGTMRWHQVPPVGTPVQRANHAANTTPDKFAVDGFDCSLYQSGTAALAQAIAMSLAVQSDPTVRDVLLPGYGCPDLVAACVCAGANPVIIDLDAEDYCFDLVQVQEYAKSAAAIVCPSLLGICMPIAQIKAILPEHTKVIEDDAQWFPESTTAEGRKNNLANIESYQLPPECMASDFILTSFGRGKPVNLLGGGMLLSREPQAQEEVQDNVPVPTGFRVKSALFNLLMKPFLYGALVRLPGLDLGSTVYHPLEAIVPIENFKRGLVTSAIKNYLRVPMATAEEFSAVAPCAWAAQSRRLLRLPVLVDNLDSRNALVGQCVEHGITATAMYQRALIDIPGVNALVERAAPTPNSEWLAATLVTLPTHQGITEQHKQTMQGILQAFDLRLTNKVTP